MDVVELVDVLSSYTYSEHGIEEELVISLVTGGLAETRVEILFLLILTESRSEEFEQDLTQ